jgi:hypothetical protein
LYSGRCFATTPATPQAAAAPWDEQLASLLAALIPPQGSLNWKGLEKAAAVRWRPLPPREISEPPWDDGNQHSREGEVDLSGRVLYLTATGTSTDVLYLYVNDRTTRPTGAMCSTRCRGRATRYNSHAAARSISFRRRLGIASPVPPHLRLWSSRAFAAIQRRARRRRKVTRSRSAAHCHHLRTVQSTPSEEAVLDGKHTRYAKGDRRRFKSRECDA